MRSLVRTRTIPLLDLDVAPETLHIGRALRRPRWGLHGVGPLAWREIARRRERSLLVAALLDRPAGRWPLVILSRRSAWALRASLTCELSGCCATDATCVRLSLRARRLTLGLTVTFGLPSRLITAAIGTALPLVLATGPIGLFGG